MPTQAVFPTLVERVYGHLGEVRHRAEVVKYCNPPAVIASSDEVPFAVA